jgi:hypothetical protein
MEDQMTSTRKPQLGSITGCVIDCGRPEAAKPEQKSKKLRVSENVDGLPIIDASIQLFCVDPAKTADATPERTTCSNDQAEFEFKDLQPGDYWVRCYALAWEHTIPAEVTPCCSTHICFEAPIALNLEILAVTEDCKPAIPCASAHQGRTMLARAGCLSDLAAGSTYAFSANQGDLVQSGAPNERFLTTAFAQGPVYVTVVMTSGAATNNACVAASTTFTVIPVAAANGSMGPNSLRAANGAGLASDAGGGPGNQAASIDGGGPGNPGGFLNALGGPGNPAGAIGVGGRSGFPNVGVMLQRSAVPPTPRLGFWARIRNHSKAVSFGGAADSSGYSSGYQGFIDRVLCGGKPPDDRFMDPRYKFTDGCPAPDVSDLLNRAKTIPLHGMTAYELLMTATEIFLLWNCGVVIQPKDAVGHPLLNDEEEFSRAGVNRDDMVNYLVQYLPNGRLPYIERVVRTAFPGYGARGNSVFCANMLSGRADCVCLIELIWSYWLEEGMLAQSLNAISRRFQNIRGPGDRDPLAHLEIDPLRPLNNLMWGYLQNEQNQLTVKRRAYEYDHHYGLTLYGKAVPALRSADSRSKFIEGFHNLLHRAALFYKEDNDTTVIADGFPLINALKEVHLLLAQGAHNQFGDLPWTARCEMMVQQWLLARPEMRDFLQSRAMVPYTEAWMPQVDTMKTMQGWSDVTITHFRDLAVYGEQILLSVRYDDWIDVSDENDAKNWARYWRPDIQNYIHAYRTVTGIDLTNPDTVDYTKPGVHLQKRLAMQRAR